jgi:hypothetical protein
MKEWAVFRHPNEGKQNEKKNQEKERELGENIRPRHRVGLYGDNRRASVHVGRIVMGSAQKTFPPEAGNGIMTRNILRFTVLTTLVAAVSLHAEPTPSADRPPSKNAKSRTPPAKTNAAPNSVPSSPLAEGWNYVKGEWIHSDGYKYVNGKVTRTGSQTHKRPPKPPAKALLNSVKVKPAPTPVPGSAAEKAAEIERNKRPRPAPQTGTHM